MELKNKRIIVTGSSSGMGAGTLRSYVSAGADVIGMDIADETGEKVVAEANAKGPGSAEYLHIDVTDEKSVETAFAEAVKRLGGLDVLAHPAATMRSGAAHEVTLEDWDFMFDVVAKGTMLTNRAAYSYMKEAGGGSIINFGSVSGQRSEPGSAAYSAAKGAVHSWTRSAAAAWGADNIRVNAILPAIQTPLSAKMHEFFSQPEELEKLQRYQMTHTLPALNGGEYGDADKHLGPVMVFFASDASSFITSQMIPVDGGQANVR